MVVEFSPEKRPEDDTTYKLRNGEIVFGASTVAGVDKPNGPLMAWAVGLSKKGIDYKKFTDEAAMGGSIGHFLIECWLQQHTPAFNLYRPSEDNMRAGNFVFDKFKVEWESEKFIFVHSELSLVSERHKYGGKLDVIARDVNGKLTLIDIKSSKGIYGSHLVQLSGYENLWNEQNAERITRRAIFRNGRKEQATDTETRWVSTEDIALYFAVFLSNLSVLQTKGALKAKGKLI